MKIGVDIRCLMPDNYSGVSWYTFNLLKSIFEVDTSNEYILFYNNSQSVNCPKLNYSQVRYACFKYPNKILNAMFVLANRPQIDKMIGGVDVFFMPNINLVAWSSECFKVITVHDLSYWRYPQFFTWKSAWWHKIIMAKKIISQADIVMADSTSTKNDLLDLVGINESKIKVVYPGLEEKFKVISDQLELKKVKDKYKLPDKFILYLGTLEPRKNVESLIEAFNGLNSDYHLILAGGKGWKNKQITALVSLNRRIKMIGYVAEEDKRALYNLADLLVYPSYYEGFGLPPVEALACGTPVIVGANSSQTEAIKNGGLAVDPYNINEIKRAMAIILTDQEVRNKFISTGLKIAGDYKWEKTAQETINIFNNLSK